MMNKVVRGDTPGRGNDEAGFVVVGMDQCGYRGRTMIYEKVDIRFETKPIRRNFAYPFAMSYSNKHLTEVICSFDFIEDPAKWDSIFFGSYYEKIRPTGFTERQERKAVKFQTLPDWSNNGPMAPVLTPGDQFVFKNPAKNWGITMSQGVISFHILKDYTGWNAFRDDLIHPFYALYLDLGLGSGRRNCTVMYLNRFDKPVSEHLSNYFTIVSDIDKKFGPEKNTIVQRLFKGPEEQLLLTKLVTHDLPNAKYQINFECGALSLQSNMNWLDQAEQTHAPIQSFFESIITDRQRQEL
jgi:uncharacterized protein (TIGR04255 family)